MGENMKFEMVMEVVDVARPELPADPDVDDARGAAAERRGRAATAAAGGQEQCGPQDQDNRTTPEPPHRSPHRSDRLRGRVERERRAR